MRPEELFAAIGSVEESRLARTELTMSSAVKQEDRTMKPARIIRNLLVAAVIVSMLAVTAYAVGGWLIYDTPEEMIASIFGDKTGYDHGDYTEISDPERPDSLLAVQPEFDRVEADPTVVAEDIAPYVSPVGKSIEYHGMKLTVDAFVYDDATQCGIVTYTLENGPAYNLQSTGEIWYEGRPDPVYFSHYGYPYIIQEKSSEGKLAAAYYFRYDKHHDEDGFYAAVCDGMTVEEHRQQYAEAEKTVREKYTTEEMIRWAKEDLGQEQFQTALQENGMTEEELAFLFARDYQLMEWAEGYSDKSGEKIYFDCSESRELKHLTLAEDSIIISPISIEVDITDLTFLHTDIHGSNRIHAENLNETKIRFKDGSEYLVRGGEVENTHFAVIHTTDGTMESDYAVATYMFNRVIDIDQVAAVILNSHEFPVS